MNWKLFFFCFYALSLTAQGEFAFRNYTLESGLPSNTIYECFQDQKGYIYIGHNKGCTIFNGLSFQTPTVECETSAISNFISFSNGKMMCRNFQGKKFVLKNNKLELLETSLKEAWGFPTFIEDGNKHYIFQSGSFYSIDELGKGKEIKLPNDILRIYHCVVHRDKAFLFGSKKNGNALICYDLKLKQIISSKDFVDEHNIQLFKVNSEVYWLDNRSGACGVYANGFIEMTNLYASTLPKESKITGFSVLKDGSKLISTFNGIYRLNKNWQLENHYLDGIQCTHLLLDKNNGLWISSLQNGIFYVPQLDVIEIKTSALSGRNVKFSKVYTHDNFMYVGTYDGRVLRFNQKGQLVKTYDFNRSVEIQSMFITNNELYVYCGGLLTVDMQSGAIKNELISSACKSIYVEGEQMIFGTSKGMQIYENGALKTYLDTLWVKKALPLENNKFLLECAEEIIIFNRTSNKLKQLQFGGTNICVLDDKFYYRTAKGVYELDAKLRTKKIYTSRISITQLYVSEGKLTLDLENRQSIQLYGNQFSKQVKLPNSVLNNVSFFGELGQYRIKGNNNTIQLIPKNQRWSVQAPRIWLVNKKGNYKVENDVYVLPHDNNELTFEFDILPNYNYNGQGELYYRIAELNGEWRKALKGNKYVVELLRIPSGKYTLEFYAENERVYSAIKRFTICVEQPFYFKWWFIVFVIFMLIGVMYFVGRWRAQLIQTKNNRKLKEQELKLSALNSELTAIRSQMNPHFIFNSLSSIQTKILNEDRVEAYKNLNTFSTLLRQALQFTSKEFLTLKDEISFTRNYIQLEQTRASNAFEYKEDIDSKLNIDILRIPSLFLQPFVENAIRHGLMHSKNEKCMCIKISALENGFRVIIEDNGIGRIESNRINYEQRPEHESFATNAIQDRITILKETKKMYIDLKIIDLEKGTRVEINFQNYDGK